VAQKSDDASPAQSGEKKKKALASRPKSRPNGKETAPPSTNPTNPTNPTRYIVGIGASAGGLEAVTLLLSHLDISAPCAYVLLQHLSPTYRSMMVEILARETTLRVKEAESGEIPERGVVIVVPANHNAILKEGRLVLVPAGPEVVPKPSVNQFLISLASEEGESAVGVVLSGTGSDGTAGLRAIQSAGGFTFVQKPETAKYDGMPRAAIDAGVADRILPPDEIAAELGRLGDLRTAPLGGSSRSTDSISEILGRLKDHTHIDFSGYKTGSILRRLERRLVATGTGSPESYLSYLDGTPEELDRLSRDILISVTAFFRDKPSFSLLTRIVREITNRKTPGSEIRVWVAGCATGEEAYSIAMLFADMLDGRISQFKIQIFATDIDENALSIARRGVYSAAAMSEVSSDQIRRYFRPFGQNYEVSKFLRDMIVFARHNLVGDPPFMRLDMVSCRNVLIYFDSPLQTRVLTSFHFGLSPDSFLFLGHSESIAHGEQLFTPVDKKNRIFRKLSNGEDHTIVQSADPVGARAIGSASRRERRLLEVMLESLAKHLDALVVMVDPSQEIILSVGDSTPYLSFPQGRPRLKIGEVVVETLRGELLAVLHRSMRRREEVSGRVRKIAKKRIRLHVRPIEGKVEEGFLVLFVPEQENILALGSSEKDPSFDVREDVLEDELVATREHLQTLIEEMSTANEEMQALNEESQASNEELQATNEELEAANEELQASNEELVSLNEELSVKTSELAKLNSEFEHLFNALDFPLMLFDPQFVLRRFNSPATREFGLKSNAMGQPLQRLRFPDWLGPLEGLMGAALAHSERETLRVGAGERDCQIIITPGLDSGGQTISLLVSVVDLTDVLRAQRELDQAKSFVNALMERTTVMYTIKDIRGEYIYANSRFSKFFGVDAKNVKGKNDFSLLPKPFAAELWASDLEALREGQPVIREHSVFLGNMTHFFEAVHLPLYDGNGNLTSLSTEMLDVTFRRHAEEQLRLAAKVFDRAGEGIIVTDGEGRISTVNPVFESITGFSAGESIGKTPGQLLNSGRQSENFYRDMWRQLGETGNWRGEIWNKRKTGEIYPEWLTINRVDGEDGKPTHYIGIFSDITDIKNAQVRADFLSTHDSLTGLANRALLLDRLRLSIASSRRDKTMVALAFIDLDNFKVVNDSRGHEVGDVLLRSVSERLSSVVRESDTLARLGGDEFVVVMESSDPSEVEKVGARILDEIGRSFEIGGQKIFVTGSIGVAFYPQDAEDSASLLQAADTAMYRAKESGRNRLEFFRSEMRVKIMERATIETALRGAIAEKNLYLVYQPRVDSKTGRIVGAESLARWIDASLGEVSPARFIPVAEQSGLIVDLTRLLLRKLFDDIGQWLKKGFSVPPISFNLSSRDFHVGDTAPFILEEMKARSLSPSQLEIEVTERTMMEDIGVTHRNLRAFHEAGIKVVIDDFGTGYSSLSYLKLLPVSTIKIDRSFVDGLPDDEGDAGISSAIIGMAKALGISLVAEGVEKHEQAKWLLDHGCHSLQGYLYFRPLSVEDFRNLLEKG